VVDIWMLLTETRCSALLPAAIDQSKLTMKKARQIGAKLFRLSRASS